MSKEEFPSEKNLDEKDTAPKKKVEETPKANKETDNKEDQKLAKQIAELEAKNKELEDKYLRSEAEIKTCKTVTQRNELSLLNMNLKVWLKMFCLQWIT